MGGANTHIYRSTHVRTHAYFRFREVPVVAFYLLFDPFAVWGLVEVNLIHRGFGKCMTVCNVRIR